MSTTFALLAFLFLGTTSCNKYKRNPADSIVGDYIGTGTDANEFPYFNQIIRVTKVSKKRVKVEPVGHNSITAFEIDVEGFVDQVSSTGGESESLAADIQGEAITLAFTTPNDETFAGTKQ